MRIGKIGLLSGVALSMCILVPQIHAQEAPKSYDLPEQDLGDALRAIARPKLNSASGTRREREIVSN